MSQRYGAEFAGDAAKNYEKYFVPAIGEPVARDLVEVADLKVGEKVLDVACGTGIVTRMASKKVGPEGSVTGLDVNPGMLAVAEEATRDPSVQWVESSAEAIPLPDESFDVVTCQLSLQFVPDKLRALQEMRRVLKPGGRIALNVPGEIGESFHAMADALERNVSAEASGFVRHVFSLNRADQLKELMDQAGFEGVEVRETTRELELPPARDFLWQYVQSTPMAAVLAEVPEDAKGALEEEFAAEWEQRGLNGTRKHEQRLLTATATA